MKKYIVQVCMTFVHIIVRASSRAAALDKVRRGED